MTRTQDMPLRALSWLLSDIGAMTQRNLLRYVRVPQLLVFSTIQPVMFVLLFTYVFGGAIHVPTAAYIDYLLPGILIQTVLFGAGQTGVGLADDLSRGMVDRFRSLPMARSAVLVGRTFADLLRNIFVVSLMIAVGMLLGFRFHGTFLATLGAMGFAVFFGFAFSWVFAALGLIAKNAEAAQVGSFIPIFPLVFASSLFVPIATMPDWLQWFATRSPVTAVVNTVRALALGTDPQPDVWRATFWTAAILAAFVPIAVRLYRRRA
jgi:ABC transporter DrrB family efflux protein